MLRRPTPLNWHPGVSIRYTGVDVTKFGPMTDIAFPDHEHDHDSCVADALSVAETVCTQRGARLTDLRRAVLELVWESHAPIGA